MRVKKKKTPKYVYPEGLGPWMVEPYPVKKRKRFVALARRKGVTTPALIEEILDEYMEKEEA